MNNDLISRKALKDKIRNQISKYNSGLDVFTTKRIFNLIDNAPTVSERPKGEWGKRNQCPFCSYIRQWEDDKFCGNCGADLRKGGAE